MNISELVILYDKIQNKTATRLEEDAFIDYVYNIGKISRSDYHSFKCGQDCTEIMMCALISAAAVILSDFLRKHEQNV